MKSSASFFEAAAVALDSLRNSKLRSFLTLLGIILSTTTLIAVMSAINGLEDFVANSATTMGGDGFRVLRFAFVGNFDPKKFLEAQRKNPQLSPEEFEYLRGKLTLARESAMSIQRGVPVSYEGDQVQGVVLFGNEDNGAIMTNTEIAMYTYSLQYTARSMSGAEIVIPDQVARDQQGFADRSFPARRLDGRTVRARCTYHSRSSAMP